MALNFPCCATIPFNSSEGNMVPSILTGDKNGEGLLKPSSFNVDGEDSFDLDGDGGEGIGGSCEPVVSDDIVNLLPSDPFGMELSATFTAIAGWIRDFEFAGPTEDRLVTGLSMVWNQALEIEPEAGNEEAGGELDSCGRFGGLVFEENGLGDVSCDGEFVSFWGTEEFRSFGDEYSNRIDVWSWQTEDPTGQNESCSSRDEGDPHDESLCGGDERAPNDALIFALSYLGVRDLLSAERVCKSMCSAIRNDPLLWRRIHIGQPLNKMINDDALLWLTTRAQGGLQCLSLAECPMITDDGLKRVLESNPRLTKLCVPGCTRLSIEGLLNNIKSFKFSGISGIKCLQIGGVYGVTHNHFEELKLLLDADRHKQPKVHKQRFYHLRYSLPSWDDEWGIDIEVCPRCQNLRLVYDCPAESCQGKQLSAQQCRACCFCIARCIHCGTCINNGEYQETFFLDLLCSNCWKQLFQYQDKLEEKGAGSMHKIFHEEMRYRVCLYQH